MFRGKAQYVPISRNKEPRNEATTYARNLVKSEFDRYGSDMMNDYQKIMNQGCFYLPNFFCQTSDRLIYNNLKNDIDANDKEGMVQWSKHYKHENPEFSETFNDIIKKMGEHFGVEVIQTRMNYYGDGLDWKPFHHDRNAYGKTVEDFTMGASFGDTRELEFKHERSGSRFKFPQNNGDVFAFNSEINKIFLHGVPKSRKKVGPRISIIAWGKKLENK